MGESSENTEVVEPTKKSGSFKRNLILLVALGGALVAGWLFAGAVLPRWWAQRVGDLVGGRLLFGSFVGFGVGACFVILPLLVLRTGWRFRGGWKRWLGFTLAAAIAAGPNLATLGIVIGKGDAAHAGERILDVDGPGFRGGSLVGALVGGALMATISALLRSRRRSKREAAELKAELVRKL